MGIAGACPSAEAFGLQLVDNVLSVALTVVCGFVFLPKRREILQQQFLDLRKTRNVVTQGIGLANLVCPFSARNLGSEEHWS